MEIIGYGKNANTKNELSVTLDQLSSLSNEEIKSIFIPQMNMVRFQNESQDKNQFEGFNDGMMVAYFLYRDKHIDSSKMLSEKTIQAYKSTLTRFLADFHDYGHELGLDYKDVLHTNNYSILKALKPRHIEYYSTWLQDKSPYVRAGNKPYSAASLAQKIQIIKGFLNKLFEWQYIQYPIHLAFKSVTLTKHDKPNRDVTPTQVKYLLDLFKQLKHFQLFCITHFLVTTGIRNTEFCNLRVGDIHYNPISDQYYMKVIAKGNKDREIPLLPKTIETMRLFRRLMNLKPFEEMQLENPNAPLFTTSRKNAFTPTYLDHYYARQIAQFPEEELNKLKLVFSYMERENTRDKQSDVVRKHIAITPHAFRHAYAIISHHSGVSLDIIKDSLGHSDRKTTEIYLESIIKQEQNAVHQWNEELMGGYI